tara:strand:- start:1880 stop:3073 length:1194 start_codon:yes stop_codon:yes gene_type:complete
VKIDGKYPTQHLGKISLTEACHVCNELNKKFEQKKLAQKESKLIAQLNQKKVIGKYHHSTKNLVKEFITEAVMIQNKESTRSIKILKLKKIAEYFNDTPLAELETMEWRTFLQHTCNSPNVYPKFITLITHFYDWAFGMGYLPASSPNYGQRVSISKFEVAPTKERERMSIEQFQLLYKHSEPALQDMLKFGILTGLRLSDIRSLEFEQIKDGYLYVVPEKTADLAFPRKIRFKITPDLVECGVTLEEKKSRPNPLRPDKDIEADCPFIFNYVYDRDNKSNQKKHSNQILANFFGQKLRKTVEKIDHPLWSKYRPKNMKAKCPRFHEVRGLYADLCEAVLKLSEQEISKRLGHQDKTETNVTKKYLTGSWFEVSNDITFDQIMSLSQSDIDKGLGIH